MKSYPLITQGTLEWHIIRWGKIGGTGSGELHTKGDALLNRLTAAQMEPYNPEEEGYASKAMERGTELEPLAVASLGEYLGLEFKETGWIEHDTCSILGMSPDGITEDSKDCCETKCPSLVKHIAYIRAGQMIPKDYLHQVISPFSINPLLERNHFASFRPECKIPLHVVTITRETEINVGTVAKPVFKTVGEVAMNKFALALALEEEVKKEVERISF